MTVLVTGAAGFIGSSVAMALLGRGEPIAIIGTGLLFGALEAGAGAMQREAGIPAVGLPASIV